MAQQESKDDDMHGSDDFIQIYLVEIGIEKATDLKKADVFGKSDPYCLVTTMGQTYSTKTIMKTLNPHWGEETQFCFFNDPEKLNFTVFDWDKGSKDDPIGDVELSLNGFFDPNHQGFKGALQLQNVKKGSIDVWVKCKKLFPVEVENKAAKLEKELDDQQETMENNIATIADLTEQNMNMEASNTNLKDEIEDLNKKKAELENRIAELTTQEENAQTELTTLKGQQEEEQKGLDETTQKHDSLQGEVTTLQNNLATAEKENKGLNDEVDNLKKQCDLKDAELQSLRERIANKKKKPTSPRGVKPTTEEAKPTPAGAPKEVDTQAVSVDNEGSKCCNIL